MSLLQDRERAFESLFAHEEEMRFLAGARRNRLFGTWAAELLGLRGAEREAYVRAFLRLHVERQPDEALIDKVRGDLRVEGIEAGEEHVRGALAQAAGLAARRLAEDAGGFPPAAAPAGRA
jgi:hypothetical protein